MFFFPLLAATAHSPARPTRAAFTLLAVTHAPPTLGVVTPPPGVPEPAAGRAEPGRGCRPVHGAVDRRPGRGGLSDPGAPRRRSAPRLPLRQRRPRGGRNAAGRVQRRLDRRRRDRAAAGRAVALPGDGRGDDGVGRAPDRDGGDARADPGVAPVPGHGPRPVRAGRAAGAARHPGLSGRQPDDRLRPAPGRIRRGDGAIPGDGQAARRDSPAVLLADRGPGRLGAQRQGRPAAHRHGAVRPR